MEDYFDFEEKTEEPEEHNFQKLRQCPHCRKPVPEGALMCLYCGEAISYYQKPKWIVWVSIIMIVAFLALIFF